MELGAVAYGVLVRVVRGLAGRLGGLGGLGGSGCRRVSGEGAGPASESGLVSKSLVSRARFTQIAGASPYRGVSGVHFSDPHPKTHAKSIRQDYLYLK